MSRPVCGPFWRARSQPIYITWARIAPGGRRCFPIRNLPGSRNRSGRGRLARVTLAFSLLQQLPGARPAVDIAALARVMDSFFWNLLGEAARMDASRLEQAIGSSAHLIYHALFPGF